VIGLLLLLELAFYPTVYIGSFPYAVMYSPDTLGKTSYPLDDDAGHRYITMPANMDSQIPMSWEHEKIHACLHAHSHHFKTEAELKAHLEKTMYSEEEVATILTPCLLELETVDLRHHDSRKSK
jgi:hypothetical protein